MGLTFKRLHPHFVGEASPIELRRVHDPETLAAIRAGMDEYAVCVFRDQAFTDDEHLGFAQRLDGALHTKLGSAAIQKNRFGNEALGDISNLGADGEISRATTAAAPTASATVSGTPTPRSRIRRDATRCCTPR